MPRSTSHRSRCNSPGIDAPEADWRAAAVALSELAQAAVAAATLHADADAGDADRRREVLASVIHGRFRFAGDTEHYDDPANANLIQVTERRRGLPVALGVLWLHAAEAAGWVAHGIDFPGHFLVAVEGGRGQALVDVFAGGTGLAAPDLRALIKRIEGEKAELRPGLLRLWTSGRCCCGCRTTSSCGGSGPATWPAPWPAPRTCCAWRPTPRCCGGRPG